MLAFRDYLRENPELAREYSEVKKQASKLALQMKTKDEMKAAYAYKKPFVDKINKELKGYKFEQEQILDL